MRFFWIAYQRRKDELILRESSYLDYLQNNCCPAQSRYLRFALVHYVCTAQLASQPARWRAIFHLSNGHRVPPFGLTLIPRPWRFCNSAIGGPPYCDNLPSGLIVYLAKFGALGMVPRTNQEWMTLFITKKQCWPRIQKPLGLLMMIDLLFKAYILFLGAWPLSYPKNAMGLNILG